jgi:hypothetical protein
LRRSAAIVVGVLVTGLVSACGLSVPAAPSGGNSSPVGPLVWSVDDLGMPAELRDVALGDGRLIAIGYSHWEEPAVSAVLVSDDRGRTWRPAMEDGLDAGSMIAVTHGPAGYVAVGRPGGRGPGRDGSIWSSEDGSVWRPVDPPTRVGGADLQAVVASDDRYVAGGMEGPMPVVWVSSDGVVWQQAPPFYGPPEYPSDVDLSGDAVTALAMRDGTFVAALGLGEHRGEIWSSDDGLTWAPIGRIEAYWISRLVWSEGRLLAIGTFIDEESPLGVIWSSPDGVTWTTVAELGAGDGHGLADGAGGFVATSTGWHGEPGIWTSADGETWVRDEAATKGGGGAFVGNLIGVDEGYVGVGSRGQTVDDSTMVVWHGAPAP